MNLLFIKNDNDCFSVNIGIQGFRYFDVYFCIIKSNA